MLTSNTPETPNETPDADSAPATPVELDFSSPALPISDFAGAADFPQGLLGFHVNIGGITGIVTEIVKHSLKITTPEREVQRFNAFALRKLYGPALRPEPAASRAEEPTSDPVSTVLATDDASEEAAPASPERHFIEEPDFSTPVQPIDQWIRRPNFPQCVFGVHVDVVGYTGVVVEIVKQSLKVRSEEGDMRSYNVAVLRKLYGGS